MNLSVESGVGVSSVDKVVDQRGTRKEARVCLDYLWSPAA
ncbi:hypothetical protein R69888_06610 [Paraburkholderia haematera]|uniref:Uncharacterized protein n=1 Tax=Paraburkholderia haematera TaxID=2793077 RepID=A0ABM8STG0_9BURK|nr:hypothetical protein R69888_06610 [Paraburkholderia haematera]